MSIIKEGAKMRAAPSFKNGGEDMEDIVTAIANLGFPIAISIFLLVRIEGRMEKLTESINALSNTISSVMKND
jgi:hypothetical protein